ncbi:hypothetical protein Gbth_028_046 [Gluconobacter thailandicus F149-1 = NBRC 100600]|uniref:Uncharacterized protein n=2 Tax=Gluconobacter thailandicus TaxID=257438 RepID=A0AAJ0VI10_GLUTH|nr:hypothetical protein [Gluconobacter thailandicus]AFW02984.1 hypothetical protein B932_3445 [Gluconobacter oxydans H24]ANQ41613.1 hypothetical protein BAR24_09125 [Gluconobacter oxydans]GAN89953.1 hypothetical protein Gbfr_010_028 [Gluconobacter frateurii M-2]KXV35184.1 hypothetical protein AD940_03650 [Gluconobacter thailandicus]KXV53032.1 hypothetical protein AD946_09740 [Gluconobacter thailandicus]
MSGITLNDFLSVTRWTPAELAAQIDRNPDDVEWWLNNQEHVPERLTVWMSQIVDAFRSNPAPKGYAMERSEGCIFNDDPSITVVCSVCRFAATCTASRIIRN